MTNVRAFLSPSEPVRLTMLDGFSAAINEAPNYSAITLCANSNGRPWTVSGFNSSWRNFKNRLQRENKVGSASTLYGMRRTTAVMLREMGLNERQIADWLGQSTIVMARHDARGADLRAANRKIGTVLNNAWNSRRKKLSNHEKEVATHVDLQQKSIK